MSTTPIRDEWNTFRELIHPALRASELFMGHMEKAFFAGATVMFSGLTSIPEGVDPEAPPTAEEIGRVDVYAEEIRTYIDAMRAGVER